MLPEDGKLSWETEVLLGQPAETLKNSLERVHNGVPFEERECLWWVWQRHKKVAAL